MPETFGMKKSNPKRSSFAENDEKGWRGRASKHIFGSKSNPTTLKPRSTIAAKELIPKCVIPAKPIVRLWFLQKYFFLLSESCSKQSEFSERKK